ncbi:hypothetical protein IMZ48_20685 [Candidatus Bathyarchaeota archaeon]|nr:hypothetical protein [Candidatus Bathyarchaeota archaeon]
MLVWPVRSPGVWRRAVAALTSKRRDSTPRIFIKVVIFANELAFLCEEEWS